MQKCTHPRQCYSLPAITYSVSLDSSRSPLTTNIGGRSFVRNTGTPLVVPTSALSPGLKIRRYAVNPKTEKLLLPFQLPRRSVSLVPRCTRIHDCLQVQFVCWFNMYGIVSLWYMDVRFRENANNIKEEDQPTYFFVHPTPLQAIFVVLLSTFRLRLDYSRIWYSWLSLLIHDRSR